MKIIAQPTFISRSTILLITMLLTILYIGCGPGMVKFQINAVENLSPGPDGEPHPVIVKIYMLKQKNSFESAEYSSLWNKPQETLGEDLSGKPLLIEVAPGEKNIIKELPKPKEAAFIGIVAGYHNPEEDGWRRVVSLLGRKTIVFYLTENKIRTE